MVMMRRTTRVAGIATAARALSHPLTHRIPAAVIPDDLVNGINRTSAGGVTDNATGSVIASPIGFDFSWNSDADSGKSGDDSDDFFHGGVWFGIPLRWTQDLPPYSAPRTFFRVSQLPESMRYSAASVRKSSISSTTTGEAINLPSMTFSADT